MTGTETFSVFQFSEVPVVARPLIKYLVDEFEYSTHDLKISMVTFLINLDSILKSRDITLPAKVHLVKAMVFPAVMSGCESWTIKKAECQRINAFELWCWRRLLRVPWTTRRPNQSILKEISPEYSLERHVEAETPILWPPDMKS